MREAASETMFTQPGMLPAEEAPRAAESTLRVLRTLEDPLLSRAWTIPPVPVGELGLSLLSALTGKSTWLGMITAIISSLSIGLSTAAQPGARRARFHARPRPSMLQ